MSLIVVSGVGLISAMGANYKQNFEHLSSSKHALKSIQHVDTIYAEQFPFGEISYSTEELLSLCKLKAGKGYTRTILLGILALKEALTQSGLHNLEQKRVAFINATSVGGMCEVEKNTILYFEKVSNYMQYANTIDWCRLYAKNSIYSFNIKNNFFTISTACSSSANALQLGARLIEQNKVDIAICGGTDALTRFTINGFNSLKNIDKNFCRPFDNDRNGLNLGEGAAYLILEKDSACKARQAVPLAHLAGYANYNESYHATAPNPEGVGAYQAMKLALEKASLSSSDISYINAHGTATLTNDESEANAIIRLFQKLPSVSSTKCYTGHTLAAAAAIEACYSIMALEHQVVFANLNFETPMQGIGLIPQTIYEKKRVKHVMSNSFAFGGNNASLIFSLL
ncbi:MAG: beta-ketoacyl-[acyl-carrier-protein] synthase family protein [Chitinophagaceae bacterium]